MQAIRVTETEFCIYFPNSVAMPGLFCKGLPCRISRNFNAAHRPTGSISGPMKDALNDTSSDHSRVGRKDRWTPRSWVACCVCSMQAWQEERIQAYIAGDACCFINFQAVADVLHPARYIRTWPMVPAEEIRASAVELQMPTGEKQQK